MEVLGLDEKLYLSVSLIVSALVMSGTIFLVGASVNDNLTGLTVAIENAPAPTIIAGDSGDPGTVTVTPPNPTPPTPTIDMQALLDDDEFEGNEDAPVTIVEFSDFQCPFCSRFYSQTLPQLKENYIDTGKVKLIYRDFPLSFHPEAQGAAEAGECASDQGKFWEFHDYIF